MLSSNVDLGRGDGGRAVRWSLGQQSKTEVDEQASRTRRGVTNGGVIVQLADSVQDGTRCQADKLDMCIQGKCQVSIMYGFLRLKPPILLEKP